MFRQPVCRLCKPAEKGLVTNHTTLLKRIKLELNLTPKLQLVKCQQTRGIIIFIKNRISIMMHVTEHILQRWQNHAN